MRAFLIKAATALRAAVDLRDLFVFGGLGAAAFGIWQIDPPAAWIAAGAALFWLGVRK